MAIFGLVLLLGIIYLIVTTVIKIVPALIMIFVLSIIFLLFKSDILEQLNKDDP